MSLYDLTGKVALITGSPRGIAKSIAEAIAEQGGQVVISSRKVNACRATAEGINQLYGDGAAFACAANIGSKEDLRGLVDAARAIRQNRRARLQCRVESLL